MLAKQNTSEDAKNVVLRHLSDMVKAGLLESQCPVVERYTHRYRV